MPQNNDPERQTGATIAKASPRYNEEANGPYQNRSRVMYMLKLPYTAARVVAMSMPPQRCRYARTKCRLNLWHEARLLRNARIWRNATARYAAREVGHGARGVAFVRSSSRVALSFLYLQSSARLLAQGERRRYMEVIGIHRRK